MAIYPRDGQVVAVAAGCRVSPRVPRRKVQPAPRNVVQYRVSYRSDSAANGFATSLQWCEALLRAPITMMGGRHHASAAVARTISADAALCVGLMLSSATRRGARRPLCVSAAPWSVLSKRPSAACVAATRSPTLPRRWRRVAGRPPRGDAGCPCRLPLRVVPVRRGVGSWRLWRRGERRGGAALTKQTRQLKGYPLVRYA